MATKKKTPAIKPERPVATREEIVMALGETLALLKEVTAQRDTLHAIAHSRVSEAIHPIVCVYGDYTVDQAERLTQAVRDLGGDGIVAVLAHGNSLFSLSEVELLNLGLMRIGMGN
jgi:hypothetical protein